MKSGAKVVKKSDMCKKNRKKIFFFAGPLRLFDAD